MTSSIALLTGWHSSTQPLVDLVSPIVDELNLNLVLVQYPGYANEKSWPEQDFFSELTKQIPKHSILLGWSLGGMIAAYLVKQSNAIALITLASNLRFQGENSWQMNSAVFKQFYESFTESPTATFKRFLLLQTQGGNQTKKDSLFLKALAEEHKVEFDAAISSLRLLGELTIENIEVPSLHCLGQQDSLVPVSCLDQWLSISNNVESFSGNHLFFRESEVEVRHRLKAFIQKVLNG